ncbi:glycosyltransferase family 39 protein [Kitasatospora aburaviensis]
MLVLHRAVRRHAGPPAALLAAAAMACTPVAAALAHFAWPDTLLTLLLVLAADATLRAVDGGRLGPLLMAGVWVGLAVHAKMLEAWGVLPALAAVHLLAAPTALARRLRDLALAGVVTAAVSCAWMAVVWAVPAEDRPYVDATSDNDPFSMVFDYNGLDRFNAQTQSAGTYPTAAVCSTRSSACSAPRSCGCSRPRPRRGVDAAPAPPRGPHRPRARRGAALGRLARHLRHGLQRRPDQPRRLRGRARAAAGGAGRGGPGRVRAGLPGGSGSAAGGPGRCRCWSRPRPPGRSSSPGGHPASGPGFPAW